MLRPVLASYARAVAGIAWDGAIDVALLSAAAAAISLRRLRTYPSGERRYETSMGLVMDALTVVLRCPDKGKH